MRSSSAAQLITMPGVQKPHCSASCSMKASWTGCSRSPCGKPFDGRDSRAPTSIASIMQEQTGAPSSQTVQAEHAPRLHAILVPVSPSGPRSASASVIWFGARNARSAPFTLSAIISGPDVSTAGAEEIAAAGIAFVAAAPTLASADPRNNALRETRTGDFFAFADIARPPRAARRPRGQFDAGAPLAQYRRDRAPCALTLVNALGGADRD